MCYYYGTGVVADYSEAEKWFRKAAAENDETVARVAQARLKEFFPKQDAHDESPTPFNDSSPMDSWNTKVVDEELNDLEGLTSVKAEINNLAAFLKIQKQRSRHGMKVPSQTLHYVFHGTPGTGKTMVARILARIFHVFGILKTSKLTETDRSGLVGGYVGQTAIKTDAAVQILLSIYKSLSRTSTK